MLDELERRIKPVKTRLLAHPIYRQVSSKRSLQTFMETHVFAVWDFMSLAKRLQRDLTCVELPWVPPKHPECARFINEVVFQEESDLDCDGVPASHLDLYLTAMKEVGSDSQVFDRFVERVRNGEDPILAAANEASPQGARRFISSTLETALNGTTVEVAAEFLFGREDLIPDMFQNLLELWSNAEHEVPSFAYYLKRHIELDGDTHGPMARRLLENVVLDSKDGWDLAQDAAERAIEKRIRLWDSIQLDQPLASRPGL